MSYLGISSGGENEGQTVFDLVHVDGAHDDAFERVLGSEDDALFAAPLPVEGDVGHLLIFAVWPVVLVGDGLDFEQSAERCNSGGPR